MTPPLTDAELTPQKIQAIEDRAHAYKHWREKAGDSIEDTHYPDIMALISELKAERKRSEILREALLEIESDENHHSHPCPRVACNALAEAEKAKP